MLSRAARPALRAAAAAQARAAVPSSAATYATLREIEDRLKSIRNIEKITNTMKIVASTKLTRAQRAMNNSRKYGQTSNEVYESAETKALETEDKKTLIVVCSSDKGLCGGIHSSLARYVRRQAADQDFDLVIIGEKAKAQLGRTNAKSIQLSFAGIGKDVPTFADAQAIADQIVQLPTEYTDIKILYNSFLNAQSYEPSIIEAFSEDAREIEDCELLKSSSKYSKLASFKNLLSFPLKKSRKGDSALEDECWSGKNSVTPLRQQFSRASSALPNNKRIQNLRNYPPSPSTKKKFAAGLTQGVLQVLPKTYFGSPSSAYSGSSWSSPISKGDSAAQSPNLDSVKTKGKNLSLMNSYLCFGAQGGVVDKSINSPEHSLNHQSLVA